MEILLILLAPFFIIFCFYMAIKTSKEPTIVGYSVLDGQSSQNSFSIKLTETKLIISPIASADRKEYPLDQISEIELKREVEADITNEKEKSVVGRAVVGGLLLGPVGAIVGGMSGIGTKTQVTKGKTTLYMVIKTKDDVEYLYNIHPFSSENASRFLSKYRKLEKLSVA